MGAGALSDTLHRLDGRGFKAYKDLEHRSFSLGPVQLCFDHVQSDPFASPSRARVWLSQSKAQVPASLYRERNRRVAIVDYLARQFDGHIWGADRHRSDKGRGYLSIDAGKQTILERNAIHIDDEVVEARIRIGLPAAGRRIRGRAADELLTEILPNVALQSLNWKALDAERADRFVQNYENYLGLRAELAKRDLIAFVADGSILPRTSGISEQPMRDAVPFESPESLAVELPLTHPRDDGRTQVRGLGLKRGLSLIVGGGYHGKSTLLQAIERGVYAHIEGDGREWVVTDPSAAKIRAEDGRAVNGVDIRLFINNLPLDKDTTKFTTEDASGSTSQAANIVEALEAGAKTLLIDEDTSATNFMIRDARMQALIAQEKEPITPFVDRVAQLHAQFGVSTVMVVGGSGDYFDVTDTVVQMDSFRPKDVTAQAQAIASRFPSQRVSVSPLVNEVQSRHIAAHSIDASRGRRPEKIDAKGKHLIRFGNADIRLDAVEQLVDASQTAAIGRLILAAAKSWFQEGDLRSVLDRAEEKIEAEGLDWLGFGSYARPRRYEIAAAINRLRGLRCT